MDPKIKALLKKCLDGEELTDQEWSDLSAAWTADAVKADEMADVLDEPSQKLLTELLDAKEAGTLGSVIGAMAEVVHPILEKLTGVKAEKPSEEEEEPEEAVVEEDGDGIPDLDEEVAAGAAGAAAAAALAAKKAGAPETPAETVKPVDPGAAAKKAEDDRKAAEAKAAAAAHEAEVARAAEAAAARARQDAAVARARDRWANPTADQQAARDERAEERKKRKDAAKKGREEAGKATSATGTPTQPTISGAIAGNLPLIIIVGFLLVLFCGCCGFAKFGGVSGPEMQPIPTTQTK